MPPERADAPHLGEAVGGPLGIAEASLPAVAFVTTYVVTGSDDVRTPAMVAVALALVFALARLARRQSPVQAISGLLGVAFAAFIAQRSGRAEDFFLPGLLANAAYAAAFAVSVVVRRPLVGIIAKHLGPHHEHDREDPRQRRAYVRATWMWAGLFSLRLLVQLPLYLAGAVVALGVARTAMGLPLFALGLWLTWLLVRRPHHAS